MGLLDIVLQQNVLHDHCMNIRISNVTTVFSEISNDNMSWWWQMLASA